MLRVFVGLGFVARGGGAGFPGFFAFAGLIEQQQRFGLGLDGAHPRFAFRLGRQDLVGGREHGLARLEDESPHRLDRALLWLGLANFANELEQLLWRGVSGNHERHLLRLLDVGRFKALVRISVGVSSSDFASSGLALKASWPSGFMLAVLPVAGLVSAGLIMLGFSAARMIP